MVIESNIKFNKLLLISKLSLPKTKICLSITTKQKTVETIAKPRLLLKIKQSTLRAVQLDHFSKGGISLALHYFPSRYIYHNYASHSQTVGNKQQ